MSAHASQALPPAAFGRGVALLVAMVLAAGLAFAARPTERLVDTRPKVDLENMMPRQFGEWKVDPSIIPVQVSPDVQAKLDKIYNQTLARTYVNTTGDRVMLSIAFGGDQSGDGTQVHRPEFCYSAQGFGITRNVRAQLVTRYGVLPVRRLEAVQGGRVEPITYWVLVGERLTLPGLGRKLTQITYGLSGTIPDGMLVRVSSIDTNRDRAYALQEQFIVALLDSIEDDARLRLIGRPVRQS